jgi:hypothetical protein
MRTRFLHWRHKRRSECARKGERLAVSFMTTKGPAAGWLENQSATFRILNNGFAEFARLENSPSLKKILRILNQKVL